MKPMDEASRIAAGALWHKAVAVPYSSVVGQSITLHDKSGRVIAQLSVMDPGMAGTDTRKLAAAIVAALSREPAITAAYNRGRADMREEAAKVADEFENWNGIAIAAAIRAIPVGEG